MSFFKKPQRARILTSQHNYNPPIFHSLRARIQNTPVYPSSEKKRKSHQKASLPVAAFISTRFFFSLSPPDFSFLFFFLFSSSPVVFTLLAKKEGIKDTHESVAVIYLYSFRLVFALKIFACILYTRENNNYTLRIL